MNLKKLFLTNNACYKAGRIITPKGIMVHSTGANNPRLSRYISPDDGLLGVNIGGNHWNTDKPGGVNVCVHAFIGKLENGSIATYQTLPWNYRGWHAGGTANDSYIGFEICQQCGAAVKQTPHKRAKKFCSDACRMAWWKAHPEQIQRKVYHLNCEWCRKPFDSIGNGKRQYCSRACYAEARRKEDQE